MARASACSGELQLDVRTVGYGTNNLSVARELRQRLAAIPGIRAVRLPKGKLSVHEEFPDATAEAIAPFLSEGMRSAATR